MHSAAKFHDRYKTHFDRVASLLLTRRSMGDKLAYLSHGLVLASLCDPRLPHHTPAFGSCSDSGSSEPYHVSIFRVRRCFGNHTDFHEGFWLVEVPFVLQSWFCRRLACVVFWDLGHCADRKPVLWHTCWGKEWFMSVRATISYFPNFSVAQCLFVKIKLYVCVSCVLPVSVSENSSVPLLSS